MCILSMLSAGDIQTGECLANDGRFRVCEGNIKKKSLYYMAFHKLSPSFMKKELKDWAYSKAYYFEPDVVIKNPYGDEVFLYEM